MIGLLKRMLSGFRAHSGPGKPLPAPNLQQVPQAAERVASAAIETGRKPVFIARATQRALMADSGSVGGFEFGIDPAALRRLARPDADIAQRTAHVTAALVATRLTTISRRLGLARIPAIWMPHASPARNEAGIWIAIDFEQGGPPSEELLQSVTRQIGHFREAGARVVWNVTQDLGIAPDGWLLKPVEGQSIAVMLEGLKARAAQIGKLPVIATDLANIEAIEQALLGGVQFACGNMAPSGAKAAPADSILSPDAGRVAQMIGQLAGGADTAVIVSAIKGDFGLTIKLLQQVNSARFAHLGGVASIDQAIALLGRDELQRWLMVVLTQFGKQRRLSSALQEVALWRARLFELLAVERGEVQPARLFTLGLATMLGVILKIDHAKVAATLSLPPESAQALAGQGPRFFYLRVAEQIERQTLSDDSASADGFGSAERLLELSAEAWEWAEQTRLPVQAKSG